MPDLYTTVMLLILMMLLGVALTLLWLRRTLETSLHTLHTTLSIATRIANLEHQIFVVAPEALIVSDGTHIISANPAMAELFGYEIPALIGMKIDDLLPPGVQSAHADYRKGYMANPRHRAMDGGLTIEGRHADGHVLPLAIDLSPFVQEGGIRIVLRIHPAPEKP